MLTQVNPGAHLPVAFLCRRYRSPQTLRHYLMSLLACMDYAKRKKRWIECNAVADIDAPPISPGRISWLSNDERRRLIDASDKSGNPDLGIVGRPFNR